MNKYKSVFKESELKEGTVLLPLSPMMITYLKRFLQDFVDHDIGVMNVASLSNFMYNEKRLGNIADLDFLRTMSGVISLSSKHDLTTIEVDFSEESRHRGGLLTPVEVTSKTTISISIDGVQVYTNRWTYPFFKVITSK